MDELAGPLINALMQALPALIQAATDAMAQVSIDHGNAVWSQISTSVQAGDVNFLTRTPPDMSYNLGTATDLYRQFEPALLGVMTLAIVCAGFGVIGREYFGWSWRLAETLPRWFMGCMLVASLPRIYSFSIDLFNTVNDAITAVPLPPPPGPGRVDLLELAVLLIVWIVLGIRLLARMGYRLVYFVVVLILGPIGMMALVIPGAYEYHVTWRRTYIGLLLGQTLVVICLRVASAIAGPLGTSWAGIAVSAAVLMLAHDLATMFAPIRGGGVFAMAKQSVAVVSKVL